MDQSDFGKERIMGRQGVTGAITALVFLAQCLNASHASVQDIRTYSFLYTQNNTDNTRSLFAASIQLAGIERLKLDQQSYATYPWTDILCLCHNTLIGMNHSGLYSLDLKTELTTRLACDVLPRYERLSCLDHRAYGVCRNKDRRGNLVILDFDRLAYGILRLNPEPCSNPAIAVSPGHEFLAYHTQDPNGFQLTVVKTETGELICQSEPFDFQIPMISSVFFSPPLAWVDEHRILSVESYTRGKFASLILKKRTINQLTIFDLDTGRLKPVVSLPGNPLMHFPPTLIPPNPGLAPRLVTKIPGLTSDFRVNLKARKLVKDTIMGSPYRLCQGRLLFKHTELGHTKRHQISVDPTGTRIAWLQDGNLHYHDNTQAGAILVAKGCEIRGVTWIDPKASDGDLPRAPLSDGWTRFEQLALP